MNKTYPFYPSGAARGQEHSRRVRFAETQFALLSEKDDDHAGPPFAWLRIAFLVYVLALLGYYGRDILWLMKAVL